MNFDERIVISTDDVGWEADPHTGHELKRLDELTCLVRVAPGAELRLEHSDGVEGMVLGGSLTGSATELEEGTYFRLPPGTNLRFGSETGCTLFIKTQPFAAGDDAKVTRPTRRTPWLPGQGRLEVMPLHEHGTRSSALVKWPAHERFLPHRHWGGEEIFVLSGTFMDEHGTYPTGTWLRNPHLSQHHPFVEEETIILVKVGHLA